MDSWNQIAYDHGWFWHTKWWLEYLLNSKNGVVMKDHSFSFGDNGIAVLVQEGNELYCPGFIGDHKQFISKVEQIVQTRNIKHITVKGHVPGYLDISGYTSVVDLDKLIIPTKGHKAAIKKAKNYLTCKVVSDTIDRFRDDYYHIAGKVTRPFKTFDILGEWINQGFGTLLEALCGEHTAGYAYILHWKNFAYYFMSCAKPEFREYNVGHFLQWNAFELLRQKGIHYYELGEQVFNTLHHQPDEKEKNISLFKRGFGGSIIASPMSEYFFDDGYMKEVYQQRIESYIRSEYENSSDLPKA